MIIRSAIVAGARWVLSALAALTAIGCHDVSRFSSSGDHYEGNVVAGDFVRAGFDASARLCLVLDANHLQDAPGTITSSDGRFAKSALRPIPQIWHDPLSTLSFGEGRVQNLVYVATSNAIDAGADGAGDVLAIVSLMQSGDVEVRVLHGAPGSDGGAGAANGNLFGVFALSRTGGACSF